MPYRGGDSRLLSEGFGWYLAGGERGLRAGETISPEAGLDYQQSELPFKGERMKKLFTIACTLVLGGVMSFAQAGGSTAQNPPAGGTSTDTAKSDTGKKGKKHHHKGGKKSKKNSGGSTTPPPK